MFTKVESQYWRDEKMKNAPDDVRLGMLYLFTSPHRNLIGFYYLPTGYACDDLNWKPERFAKVIEWLTDKDRILYDKNNSIILVKNYFKFNPLENPNQIKSAIDKLNELPENLCMSAFDKVCTKYYHERMKPLVQRLRERYTKQEEEEVKEEVEEEVKGKGEGNPPAAPKPLPINYKGIQDAFNCLCPSLPKVVSLSETRKTKIKVRLAEFVNETTFDEIFRKTEESDFLTNRKGVNKNNWKASFDWLIENDSNYVKVLEGNYPNEGFKAPISANDKKAKLTGLLKKFQEEEQQ